MISRALCLKLLWIAAIIVMIADMLAPRHQFHFLWEFIPAWPAIYGFVSCILIIFASKFLGHSGGLMKKTDYYQQSKHQNHNKKEPDTSRQLSETPDKEKPGGSYD